MSIYGRFADAAKPQMVQIIRNSKGWTQARLAKAAGLSQGFISKVESGDAELRGEPLAVVAAALGCAPELLTYDRPIEALQITCLHAPSAQQPLRARCDLPTDTEGGTPDA